MTLVNEIVISNNEVFRKGTTFVNINTINNRDNIFGEFDPGSERTLAACLIHASRARKSPQGDE